VGATFTNNLIWPTCARVQPLKIINLASLFKKPLPAWLALTCCRQFECGKCLVFLGRTTPTHSHTHKSNVKGTCKMSWSSPPLFGEGVALGTARHVYHNRAINFIRLVPARGNILWSLHFRQLQTVESECLCILDEALSMHIIIWANKHIYFSWFSPFFLSF